MSKVVLVFALESIFYTSLCSRCGRGAFRTPNEVWPLLGLSNQATGYMIYWALRRCFCPSIPHRLAKSLKAVFEDRRPHCELWTVTKCHYHSSPNVFFPSHCQDISWGLCMRFDIQYIDFRSASSCSHTLWAVAQKSSCALQAWRHLHLPHREG